MARCLYVDQLLCVQDGPARQGVCLLRHLWDCALWGQRPLVATPMHTAAGRRAWGLIRNGKHQFPVPNVSVAFVPDVRRSALLTVVPQQLAWQPLKRCAACVALSPCVSRFQPHLPP